MGKGGRESQEDRTISSIKESADRLARRMDATFVVRVKVDNAPGNNQTRKSA